MAAKYYFSAQARRPLTFGGKQFAFSVFSLNGGAASGVYEATDPAEIEILDAAVAGRRGVRAMPEEEGIACKKKATPTLRSQSIRGSSPSPHRVVQIPVLPQLSVEERPGVPSAGRPSGVTPEQNLHAGASYTKPSIGALLKTGKVNPPKPFAASDDKTRKASARADRAKIRIVRAQEGSK